MLRHCSRVRLSVTPWTAVQQAPLSMGFSRQEHWSGLPFPSPGGSSQPKDGAHVSCLLYWQVGSLPGPAGRPCRGSCSQTNGRRSLTGARAHLSFPSRAAAISRLPSRIFFISESLLSKLSRRAFSDSVPAKAFSSSAWAAFTS